MVKSIRISCLWIFLLKIGLCNAQEPVSLNWKALSFPDLPSSIQLFENNSLLADGLPLHAVYAVIDLSDPAIELAIDHVHPKGPRLTPLEFIARQKKAVYLTTNGSFFTASGSSRNVLIQKGRTIAGGQPSLTRTCHVIGRDTIYYPTWSAWGLLPDGKQEIVWTGFDPAERGNAVIRFSAPYPNDRNKFPLPRPSLKGYRDDSTQIKGSFWKAETAIGGTPALLIDGAIRIGKEELINCPGLCGRHPRTAIGYTAENKLILMVVDGRQPTLSVGVTLPELAAMMRSAGAVGAINLDGGGSSAMLIGRSQIISNPSDATGLRAVGNVLMIRGKK